MRISHKYKFVFINIPFTGCDFINDALSGISDIVGNSDMNSPYYCHVKPQFLKKHFDAKGWKWDEYFKFAMVRNPWDRVVYRHFDLQPAEPFDDGVEYKLPYVNQQSWWVDDGDVQVVDYVCRYENIQEDFDKVCTRIGIPSVKLEIPLDAYKNPYSNYYTKHLRNVTAKACELDIGRFDYKYVSQTADKSETHTVSASRIVSGTANIPLDNSPKMPDFVIPGFQKCGTTSLKWNLKKHPDIEFSRGGELNFFNQNYSRGVDWYKRQFKNDGRVWGEKSPNYFLKNPKMALRRMRKCGLDAKFLISIRNPVNRAYSAYNHYVSELPISKSWIGWDSTKSFEENISLEMSALHAGKRRPAFVDGGFYIDYIELLENAYSADNCCIIVQEKLYEEPEPVFREIFDFLGVREAPIENKKLNAHKYTDTISDEAVELLSEIYKPYNERLFEFLGYEIQEWM